MTDNPQDDRSIKQQHHDDPNFHSGKGILGLGIGMFFPVIIVLIIAVVAIFFFAM